MDGASAIPDRVAGGPTPESAQRIARETPKRTRALRRRAAALGVVLALAAPASFADEYDPQEAGHPLRIAAYVLHPVGVALDLLIFRPAHWLVHHKPLGRIFGHERYES